MLSSNSGSATKLQISSFMLTYSWHTKCARPHTILRLARAACIVRNQGVSSFIVPYGHCRQSTCCDRFPCVLMCLLCRQEFFSFVSLLHNRHRSICSLKHYIRRRGNCSTRLWNPYNIRAESLPVTRPLSSKNYELPTTTLVLRVLLCL